jgi:hypothetical protein
VVSLKGVSNHIGASQIIIKHFYTTALVSYIP